MPWPHDWSFTGYEKIAERLEDLGLDEPAHRLLARLDWVVTEKVHGANYALVTDGRLVRAAKRKALLAPGEAFFGHEAVLASSQGPVLALFARLRAELPGLERLAVHGELYGGAYPHPQVPAVPGVQAVQTGVYYAPDIRFCAFDVAVEQPGQGRRYLDYDRACALLGEVGLPFARPLMVGRLSEALAYPLGFDSHLPGWLGLPPLAGNKAEGVVLKLNRGEPISAPGGPVRPVLKRKIAEFAEDARFHGAQKWTPRAPAGPGPLELLCQESAALCTAQRLAAAVSKVGRPGRRGDGRAREIFNLLVADVLEEIARGQPQLLAQLNPDERSALEARVRQDARAVVKDHPAR
jgi:Rnl2 family RNA ligase